MSRRIRGTFKFKQSRRFISENSAEKMRRLMAGLLFPEIGRLQWAVQEAEAALVQAELATGMPDEYEEHSISQAQIFDARIIQLEQELQILKAARAAEPLTKGA